MVPDNERENPEGCVSAASEVCVSRHLLSGSGLASAFALPARGVALLGVFNVCHSDLARQNQTSACCCIYQLHW